MWDAQEKHVWAEKTLCIFKSHTFFSGVSIPLYFQTPRQEDQ